MKAILAAVLALADLRADPADGGSKSGKVRLWRVRRLLDHHLGAPEGRVHLVPRLPEVVHWRAGPRPSRRGSVYRLTAGCLSRCLCVLMT